MHPILRIGPDDCARGNRAMAAVLLLNYHLLREGGITNDQTVYISSDDFDPFTFLGVEVAPELLHDIDPVLLQRGAILFLLCDLNDVIGEYEDDYLSQPLATRIISSLSSTECASLPEAAGIVQMVAAGESSLDHAQLKARLSTVYQRYVVEPMRALTSPGTV